MKNTKIKGFKIVKAYILYVSQYSQTRDFYNKRLLYCEMCRYINFWNNRLAKLLAANSMEAFDILLFVLLFQMLCMQAKCKMQNAKFLQNIKIESVHLFSCFEDISRYSQTE